MRETPEDLESFQALLRRSIDRAGHYLKESFQMPEHSLSAQQLARHLTGSRLVALSTVTSRGEPRIAPTGAVFYRARFHAPTLASSARIRHVMGHSAVSLSYFEGADLAVIVHGLGAVIRTGETDFADLEELQREGDGQAVSDWGPDPVYLRVDPQSVFTFARYPERFAV